MYASVRAFLDQIIDYAGLFPPAKLPLEPALTNYLRYKKDSPHAWMLGRFVCPTVRLPEMLALAQPHPDGGLLHLTALGTQSSQASEFAAGIESDVRRVNEFRRAWGKDDVIDSFEVALPKGADLASIGAQLPDVARCLGANQLRGFLEIPPSPRWREEIDGLAGRVHQLRADAAPAALGLKVRCGGASADVFPTDSQLAAFVIACRDRFLPWKATAGLHHPRRHFDASLNLWHHGFLHVFLAGLLSVQHPLGLAEITALLADEAAARFHFEEHCIGYQDWMCTVEEIRRHRATITSFGSCSFEEPVADLIALGLLDAE
jgi:hypothetical protein